MITQAQKEIVTTAAMIAAATGAVLLTVGHRATRIENDICQIRAFQRRLLGGLDDDLAAYRRTAGQN